MAEGFFPVCLPRFKIQKSELKITLKIQTKTQTLKNELVESLKTNLFVDLNSAA